jgi:hypothetical protein
VTGDDGQYLQSTEGPVDDTTVHTRNTPGIAPNIDPALQARSHNEATPAPELVSLRRSMRRPEEVERDRPKIVRPWNPIVTGLVAFALIIGIGSIALLTFLQRDRTEVVVEPPPAPTEIGGVPVRPGMKGG